jgi:hypothetical protein
MFRNFASWIIPIVKKYAVPTLQSGAESIGREALQSARNGAKDVLSGVNAKVSLNNNLSKSIDILKDKAEKSLVGSGIKRKNAF